MGFALVLESEVDLFGMYDFGLFGLLVENGIAQWLALVEDGNVFLGVQADRDSRMSHGVSGALGLDLVGDLLELEGRVLGENTCLLPSEDVRQVVMGREGTMNIVGASGLYSKTTVEVVHELRQVGIAGFPIGDAPQAQFRGQAVLEGLDGPLDAAFGLGGC